MKKIFTILTGVALLGLSSCACAATVSYFLTESNDLADGPTYAVVTIQDSGSFKGINLDVTGDIAFTVDVVDTEFDTLNATNFGLQAFSFNYDMTVLGTNPVQTLDSSGLIITNLDPADWTVTNTNGSISEFGKFDFDLAGDGASRADPLSFMISGVDGDVVDNYAVLFAGHIAGFNLTDCDSGTGEDGCTSAWFAGAGSSDRGISQVPIPASVYLMVTGLLGLVGVARRNPKI